MKDKEVLEDGTFDFTRQGKNIFMRNRMTEEEHQAWLERLTRKLSVGVPGNPRAN